MDARIDKLIAEFEKAGWKSLGLLDIKTDWWFEDIILLVSEWRPVGVPLYLTLLTDPMYIHKKIVWAVNISASLPEQKDLKSLLKLSLNDFKRTDLSQLVKAINSTVLSK